MEYYDDGTGRGKSKFPGETSNVEMMPPQKMKKKRKRRRIPGPIGDMEIQMMIESSSSSSSSSSGPNNTGGNEVPASQNLAGLLPWHTDAWLNAWNVVGMETPISRNHSAQYIIEAAKKCLHSTVQDLHDQHWDRERSGILLVMVHDIEHHQDMDTTVGLEDPTGRLEGYLHPDVVATAGVDLSKGAVLLIREASILHCRKELGRWLLNVTPNNVAMLWPASTTFDQSLVNQAPENQIRQPNKKHSPTSKPSASTSSSAISSLSATQIPSMSGSVLSNLGNRSEDVYALSQDGLVATFSPRQTMPKPVVKPKTYDVSLEHSDDDDDDLLSEFLGDESTNAIVEHCVVPAASFDGRAEESDLTTGKQVLSREDRDRCKGNNDDDDASSLLGEFLSDD